MKKAGVLLGIGLLGAVLISFIGTHKCEESENEKSLAIFYEETNSFEEILRLQNETEILKIEDIPVIEKEEEISLGFDTAQYLPLGFNAYKGMELDLDDIPFIEEEEEIDLGFDTARYLPEGFNAYEGAEFYIDDIVYIEEEEKIVLGFDTQEYLPENFNAYSK
jgi:hypothetical protein